MRHNIEESLGIKAYDIYGLTEISGPGVSFECEEQKGMHIQEDHFIPEIINPDTGEVLPEGEIGELVFTCITKKAYPLLRYRTRDLCYLTRKKCSCGRTHIRMHKPMGRSDDMMVCLLYTSTRVFIPASLVSDTYEKNLKKYDGQEIEFVITEFNPRKRRIIGDPVSYTHLIVIKNYRFKHQ